MAVQGITTIDFGAFPGASDASVAVADATIAADSFVAAWLYPQATVDHTADEHRVEPIHVVAGDVQAGVGFTIVAHYRGLGGTRAYGQWTLMYSWV